MGHEWQVIPLVIAATNAFDALVMVTIDVQWCIASLLYRSFETHPPHPHSLLNPFLSSTHLSQIPLLYSYNHSSR